MNNKSQQILVKSGFILQHSDEIISFSRRSFDGQDPGMDSSSQSLTCRFDLWGKAVKHMACTEQNLAKKHFVSRIDNRPSLTSLII